MIGGLTDEPSGVPTLYNRSQDSPGIGPALDAVSMDDLTLRIETVKKVQPQLASEHARLQTHVLQLVIKQLSESGGAHQQQELHLPSSEPSSYGTFCRVFCIPLTVG